MPVSCQTGRQPRQLQVCATGRHRRATQAHFSDCRILQSRRQTCARSNRNAYWNRGQTQAKMGRGGAGTTTTSTPCVQGTNGDAQAKQHTPKVHETKHPWPITSAGRVA